MGAQRYVEVRAVIAIPKQKMENGVCKSILTFS